VEVAGLGDGVMLRDSENLDSAPLTVSRNKWRHFVAGIKAGDFDEID
jgi:hypothetical protein